MFAFNLSCVCWFETAFKIEESDNELNSFKDWNSRSHENKQ